MRSFGPSTDVAESLRPLFDLSEARAAGPPLALLSVRVPSLRWLCGVSVLESFAWTGSIQSTLRIWMPVPQETEHFKTTYVKCRYRRMGAAGVVAWMGSRPSQGDWETERGAATGREKW